MTMVVAASIGMLVAGWPGAVVGVAAPILGQMLRRRRTERVDPIAVAARLLVLVGGGGSLIVSLERAAEGTAAEADMGRVVRRSRRVGVAAALATTTGPLETLLRGLADSAVSGAPIEHAIKNYLDSERRRRHTAAVERARRLPIRLMIPMTLLVLPGFVLMVYGPELISLMLDLLGPLGM